MLLYIFITCAVIFSILEYYFPYKKYSINSIFSSLKFNTLLVALNTLIIRVIGVSLLYILIDSLFSFHILFFVWNDILRLILTIFLLDFVTYLRHISQHIIPFLWRFHKLHHQDNTVIASTWFRFHIVEIFYSVFIKVCCIFFLGITFYQIIIYEILVLFYSLFQHSNINLPKSYKISILFATPFFHRLHHSILKTEQDSNYWIIFSFWDSIFWTRLYKDVEKIWVSTDGINR